jgi:putative addiction module CopG family antidote
MDEDDAMLRTVELGEELEAFVDKLVASGRYSSKSEVLREGVRIIQGREVASLYWTRLSLVASPMRTLAA